MRKERKPDQIMLLLSITESGKGRGLRRAYGEHGVHMHFQGHGEGTASSEIMDILRLGTSEKDILLSLAPAADMTHLVRELYHDFGDIYHIRGVAFLLPLTGINRIVAAFMGIHQQKDHVGGIHMGEQEAYSLILVAVDHGYTNDVMRAARNAGARGGTIVHGRWAGTSELEAEDFYGLSVQEEKEIVAIGISTGKRNALMESLNREMGIKTEAHAVICSLDVDAFVRFG